MMGDLNRFWGNLTGKLAFLGIFCLCVTRISTGEPLDELLPKAEGWLTHKTFNMGEMGGPWGKGTLHRIFTRDYDDSGRLKSKRLLDRYNQFLSGAFYSYDSKGDTSKIALVGSYYGSLMLWANSDTNYAVFEEDSLTGATQKVFTQYVEGDTLFSKTTFNSFSNPILMESNVTNAGPYNHIRWEYQNGKQLIRKTSEGNTAPEIKTWEWDSDGKLHRMVWSTIGDVGKTPLVMRISEYQYDEQGRLFQSFLLRSDSSIIGATSYFYNVMGRMDSSNTSGNSRTIKYTYDNFGRLIGREGIPNPDSYFYVTWFADEWTYETPITVKAEKAVNLSPSKLLVSPNPFRNSATFSFSGLSKAQTIRIFSITGRIVASFRNIKDNSTYWTPQGLPNGVYIVNLVADGKQFSKKLVLQK